MRVRVTEGDCDGEVTMRARVTWQNGFSGEVSNHLSREAAWAEGTADRHPPMAESIVPAQVAWL